MQPHVDVPTAAAGALGIALFSCVGVLLARGVLSVSPYSPVLLVAGIGASLDLVVRAAEGRAAHRARRGSRRIDGLPTGYAGWSGVVAPHATIDMAVAGPTGLFAVVAAGAKAEPESEVTRALDAARWLESSLLLGRGVVTAVLTSERFGRPGRHRGVVLCQVQHLDQVLLGSEQRLAAPVVASATRRLEALV